MATSQSGKLWTPLGYQTIFIYLSPYKPTNNSQLSPFFYSQFLKIVDLISGHSFGKQPALS